MHSSDNKLQKKRVSKACDCCRKSKTKCDGMRPCTRCLQDNKICSYMSNRKKAEKMYPSTYVDLLETRISIMVQSLEKLLEVSKSEEQLAILRNDPNMYKDDGEFDINEVICQLLSPKKLQNLSESNKNYTIDQITNVTGMRKTSHISKSATQRKYSSSQLVNEQEDEFDLTSLLNNNTSDPIITTPSTLTQSDEAISSPSSSLMSPMYTLENQPNATLVAQDKKFEPFIKPTQSFNPEGTVVPDYDILSWPEPIAATNNDGLQQTVYNGNNGALYI